MVETNRRGVADAPLKLAQEIYGCTLTVDGMLRAAQLLLNEYSMSVDDNDDWSEADGALYCLIDGLKLISERNTRLSSELIDRI